MEPGGWRKNREGGDRREKREETETNDHPLTGGSESEKW